MRKYMTQNILITNNVGPEWSVGHAWTNKNQGRIGIVWYVTGLARVRQIAVLAGSRHMAYLVTFCAWCDILWRTLLNCRIRADGNSFPPGIAWFRELRLPGDESCA